MLRAFEDEIVKQTGAEVFEVPYYGSSSLLNRMGHGMRFDKARNYLTKKSLPVEADVIWYILMGPENYELDLFKEVLIGYAPGQCRRREDAVFIIGAEP